MIDFSIFCDEIDWTVTECDLYNILLFRKVIEMNDKILWALYKRKGRDDPMCEILRKIRGKRPEDLLKEYGIEMTPPIDISLLLEKIGISTVALDFSGLEQIKRLKEGTILGAVFSEKDNLAIFYRENDSSHRQKFTIAHELGHCCLHCWTDEAAHWEYRIDESILCNEAELKKEREANIFAGELLIPESVLKEKYNRMLIPSLKNLAEIFRVSTSVMAARLDYLEMPYFKDSITEPMV